MPSIGLMTRERFCGSSRPRGVGGLVCRSLSVAFPTVISVFAAVEPTSPSWTDQLSAWAATAAAVGALATVLVAMVAVIYAKRQVDGLRQQVTDAQVARREQAQPYIVAYAEVSAGQPHFIDLVIRNLGVTGAHNVRLSCSPELQRSASGGVGAEPVMFPEAFPFLAPGQEWRTFWDSDIDRKRAELPDRYEFTAAFADSLGVEHITRSVLDWSMFRHRMWPERRSTHDIAKVLDDMRKTLHAWASRDDVVRVATYDGEAYDRRMAAERAQAEAHHRELVQEVHEAQRRWAEQQAVGDDGQAPSA